MNQCKKLHCGFTGNSVAENGDITSAETREISYEVITK